MEEVIRTVSEGNVPILAIVGVVLLTISALLGHWIFDLIKWDRSLDTTDLAKGLGFVGAVVCSAGFLLSGYWGWYLLTEGSM